MEHKILVPLATGFEEIEAVTIIDVLRRAELPVTVAGLTPGVLTGSRGIRVQPDVLFADVEPSDFDVIVLPGGMDGTLSMMADERLLEAIRQSRAAGRLTAAICAAPMVFAEAGIVSGVPITSHPAVQGRLGDAEVCADTRVVKSGSVLTSQGPGTAMEFALALVGELCGEARASELAASMVVQPVGVS